MPITEHPYHIDERLSDVQFNVHDGDQVAFMVPAGTGATTIYDMYLIGDQDGTTPTNQNTFSALRILDEINSAIGNGNRFIRKDMDDEDPYLLNLSGGAKVDGTKGLWIGDALLTYENGALRLSNAQGFWSDGYVSALGEGSGGGGGGGGGNFSREALFNVLESSPGTNEYINPSFIPIDGTSIYIQNGTLKSRGTISSIGLTVPQGLTVSNQPLTSNGTIAIGMAEGYVIPTEARLSAMETAITGLDTRVTALEDLFGIDDSGNVYVKNNRGFYSNSFVSALGRSSGSGGGGLDRQDLFEILTGTPETGEFIHGSFLKLGTGFSVANDGTITYLADSGVTALGTDGNYLTWTKNGTVNNLTVPYATKAAQDASGNVIASTYLNKTTPQAAHAVLIGGTSGADSAPTFRTLQVSDIPDLSSLYVTTSFFESLFELYNNTTPIATNGTIPVDTSKLNIKAMFGFWTESYISSLGQNSSSVMLLGMLDDVDTTGAQNGQALVYNSSTNTWVPGNVATSGVTSVGLSMPTGFSVSGSPITTSGTIAVTLASGYSLLTNSTQIIAGQKTFSANTTFSGHIYASSNGTKNIGSASQTFNGVYAQYLSFGSESMYLHYGNNSLLWGNSAIAMVSDLDGYLPLSGGTLTGELISQQVRPSTNSTGSNGYYLGTSSYRWRNVYSRLGNFSGLITASTSGIKIGDCTISWDSTNGMLKFDTGIYSTGAVSALGANSGGGGGGATTLEGLNDVNISASVANGQVLTYQNGEWVNAAASGGLDVNAMWNALSASTSEQINASHLSTALSSYVTSTAMTNALANYLPLTGGTLSGGLTTRTITPTSNNTYNLGTSGKKWSTIYTNDIYSNDFTFNDGGWLTVEDGELGYRTSTVSGNFKKVLLDGDITDTKNTAGSNNQTNTKMYLIAATSQGANPQTYSNSNCYIGTDNCLYSGGTKVLTSHQSLAGYATQSWVNTQLGSYLPLSGGTMTGVLHVLGGQFSDARDGALDMNNSDIYGLNSIYFADSSDNSAEGLHFYRGSQTVDSLWVKNGMIYFTPNRTMGYTGTDYIVLHTGNYSAVLDDRYVTLDTTQTISGAKTFSNAIHIAPGMWISESSGDNGLLVYHPSGNSTVSSSQWGVGAGNCQGVIRSNNNPLVHYKGGTYYDIIDASGGTLYGNLDISGNGGAYRLVGSTYTIGFHMGSGGTNRGIWEWTPGNKWLFYFDANNTIMNHGNVGIGTTSPGYKLHVNGTGYFSSDVQIRNTSYGGVAFTLASTNYPDRIFSISQRNTSGSWVANYMIFGSNGYVGVGNQDPSYRLHVAGTIYATGGVTALSDMRYKNRLVDLDMPIEEFAKLPLFYFKYKKGDDDYMHIGTSAQAVNEILPELVAKKDIWGLDYSVLGTTIGILNSRKLMNHEDRIKILEDENKALKMEINKLKGVA